jgi:hypothetical protein
METLTLKPARQFSYEEYSRMVQELAASGQSTGEQAPVYITATHMNAQRMKRLEKHSVINERLREKMAGLQQSYSWLVITESWCGDAAQIVPVIAAVAACGPKISLSLILRDENPVIMDLFLTNGSRSIPKLICMSGDRILGTWGPRPKAIQAMIDAYKRQHPDAAKEALHEELHLWYARDKTASTQEDLLACLSDWNLT